MKEEHEEHKHSKNMTIIVNGRQKEVADKKLTFEEIVSLAYENSPPSGPNVVITVTFSKGDDGKQGSLLPGDCLKIKNGMVFNVTATDKS